MSDPNDCKGTLSSSFLEFCAKVRSNDPSILPELGKPFRIRDLSEREHIELADALLENNNVTYLELKLYTKSSAEALAKYIRTSKSLEKIRWDGEWGAEYREFVLRHREERLYCFLHTFQESTSLKELRMELPFVGEPSKLAFENMLTHTKSLRSLSLILICPLGRLDDTALAAARSGLEKNITLRELTLEFSWGGGAMTDVSPIFTSLRDHPLLQRLCLRGRTVDLDGLAAVLLSNSSQITELDIHVMLYGSPSVSGLTRVLQAVARRPTLTKLRLHGCPLGHDDVRQLVMVVRNTPSLHTLVLRDIPLRSAGLAELASALHLNTSIKVLDISSTNLYDMESAELLRDIIRCNKTITTLNLSGNTFGLIAGAVDCIADGLGSNSTLTEINLSRCALRDGDISTLARNLGSRNMTLQKLTLYDCGIGDDGFTALMSALEQNTSLLHLDLRDNHGLSERAFLALAESLPEIKVLQRLEFNWSPGIASAMPLLLEGFRKNTSLLRTYVEGVANITSGWMQEMEGLGYRNRFRLLIRAPIERLPPLGVWPRALCRVASLPGVIFEVLRSKPSLVPS